MPTSALVTTAGSPTANAYISRAEADQYHEDRPAVGTTWSSATTDNKDKAILWATRLLDDSFCWYGTVHVDTQRLLWPRAGLLKKNTWGALDHETIPEEIKFATAEFARQLLVADRAGDSDVETQGIKSLKAGSVALEFRDNVVAKVVPDVVVKMIPEHWGYLKGTSGSRELVRS